MRACGAASSVSISCGERAAVTAREAGSPRGDTVILMVTTLTAVCANYLANSVAFVNVTRHWTRSECAASRLKPLNDI